MRGILRRVQQGARAIALRVSLVLSLILSLTKVAVAARGHNAVATEHPLVTLAAMAELRAGGNAVDAAVVAALMAGVVNATSSGIGGGGFALYWDVHSAHPTLLDFRETAPRAIDAAAFEHRPFAREQRGKAVGVPGEVMGLFELHRRFGKRPWAELVQPAIDAATNGFEIGPHLERMLRFEEAHLRAVPAFAQLFFGDKAGQLQRKAKNLALAATLRWVAALGPAAVYDGPVAADIVATVQQAGGAMSYDDLRHYQVIEREPLHISWEGYDIYTMPPPSGGGLMLAEILGMFPKSELQGWGVDSSVYVHELAEAMRGALADRFQHLGDPAFERVDAAKLLDAERLKRRRAAIDPDKTRNLVQLVAEEHGTHHLVVADSEGNFVSLTTTVNDPFGSELMTRSGIVLNDELEDFTLQRDVAAFGLKESPNRPRPGARPVSSMTPTLVVKDGKATMALGGSGGMRIAGNVTQALLSQLAFGLAPKQVTRRPRFSLSLAGPSVLLDPGYPKDLSDQLKARGEIPAPFDNDKTGVQLIVLGPGGYSAASDPRKFGLAEVR
jgi:gamma-glutamyltranspeptidase/glutathione hydrolase